MSNLAARLAGLFSALLLAAAASLAPNLAWAQAAAGCGLAAGTTPVSGQVGGSATTNFSTTVVGSCANPAITMTISGDGTGGATITVPSPTTFTMAPGATQTVTVGFTGPTSGQVVVTIVCSNCTLGARTIDLTFNALDRVDLFRDLPVGGTGVVLPGNPITLQARAHLNGSAWVGEPYGWAATPSTGVTFGAALGTTGASGEGSTTFTATNPGDYAVTFSVCDPNFRVCNPISTTFTIHVGADIQVEDGDGQRANKNTAVANPLMITASNGSSPAANVPVTWVVTSGLATVTSTSGNTNASGEATAQITMGNDPGATVTVEARRTDFAVPPAVFTLFVNDDYTLTVVSPTAPVTANLGEAVPLSVRYRLNAGANPNTVTWTVSPGTGGGVASLTSAPAAGSGIATNTFNSTALGTYTITAAGNCATAAPNCPPPSVTMVVRVVDKTLTGGGSVQGYPGQSFLLTARALDDLAPVSGVNVNWAVSGPGTPAGAVVATNASGDSQFTVTLGSTPGGSVTATATRADDPTASVSFTLGIVQPNLTVVSGNAQAGYSGTAAPQPLVALLRDGKTANAPFAGQTIQWTVLSGPVVLDATTSVTGATGQASMGFNFGATAGPSVIRATDALTGLAIAQFTATSTTPILVKTAGDGQTGPVSATFPIDLAVQALVDGDPLPGTVINWSVPTGNATVTVITQPTDANGEGTARVTANATPGMITVRASRADSPSSVADFVLESVVPDPSLEIAIVDGDNQSGLPGATLPDPLRVYLTDGGDFDAGVTVNWVVTSANATVGSATSVSNGDGEAIMDLTLGAVPGPVTITATRDDAPTATVTFHATITGPTLLIHDGDGQRGAVGSTLPQNLVVEARNDGTLVDGVNIAWTVISGDAEVSSCCATTTGGGFAGVSLTFGSDPGPVQVRAERTDASGVSVVFNVESFIAREFFLESGNDQTGDAGEALPLPLVVHARDAGADSNGVIVDWDVTSGTATLGSSSTTTGLDGLASNTLTLGATHGPVVVTATRRDDPSFVVSFDANVIGANALTVVSGNGQSGVIGSPADQPLVVRLTGPGGTPMANETITWQVTSGPGSLSPAPSTTNASGEAQVSLSFGTSPGAIAIRASALGGTLHADFSAAAVMADLSGVSGNNQSGPVNSTLPLPFKVRVNLPAALDAAGGAGGKPQALSGVPVTWAVTAGGGLLSATNTVTNAAGEAESTLTLGPNAGVNTVTATVSGGPSVTFNATGFIPSGNLTIVSGNNQTLPTNTPSEPLLVRLSTSGNVPVVGASIHFEGDNASLSANTCVTNNQGQCSITATVDLPGEASVEASSSNPSAGPVSFSLNGGVAKLEDLTDNQTVIAETIDSLCPALSNAAHDEGSSSLTSGEADLLARCLEIVDAAGLDPDAAIAALDELFPKFALVQATAALHAAQAQFDNLKARIAALRSGTHGTSFGGLALNASGGLVPLTGLMGAFTQDGEPSATTEVGADFGRWGFFASGTLGRGEADPGSTTPAYDFDINGVTAGVDYRKSDKLILGAAAGFTRQDTKIPNAEGSLDTTGWSLSAYGTYYQENSWYFDAVGTWGRNSYDVVRTIRYTLPLPGGGTSVIDQRGRMSSDGDLLSGAITFGRDFQKGGWGFGPYGRLLYTRLSFDNAVEHFEAGAGSGLALEIETRDVTSLTTTLGGKLTYTHSTDWGVLMPHFQLEWEHETKDDPASIEARFLNDPTGTTFTISGDPLDKSFFRLGLGLSMVLTNSRSGFILYERMIGRDGLEQDNLALGFRMEF